MWPNTKDQGWGERPAPMLICSGIQHALALDFCLGPPSRAVHYHRLLISDQLSKDPDRFRPAKSVTSFSLGSNDLVKSASLLTTLDSTSGAWKVAANCDVALTSLGLLLPRLSPWLVVWHSLELQATLLVIGQTGCVSSHFSDFHLFFSLLRFDSGCDLAKITFSCTGLCIGLCFWPLV